jgi:hypothetical protein
VQKKEEDVGVNGDVFLRLSDVNVLFPHQSRVAWEEWDGKGGLFAAAGLKCDADPPRYAEELVKVTAERDAGKEAVKAKEAKGKSLLKEASLLVEMTAFYNKDKKELSEDFEKFEQGVLFSKEYSKDIRKLERRLDADENRKIEKKEFFALREIECVSAKMVHFCLALKAELQDLVDKHHQEERERERERALLGMENSLHKISPAMSIASLNPATGGDRVAREISLSPAPRGALSFAARLSGALSPANAEEYHLEYTEAKKALIEVERYEDEIKTILLEHVKQIAFKLTAEGIIVAPSLVLMSSLAASVNNTFSACACQLTKMAGWQDWDGSSGSHERVVINRVGFLLKACERAFCTCPFTTHLAKNSAWLCLNNYLPAR